MLLPDDPVGNTVGIFECSSEDHRRRGGQSWYTFSLLSHYEVVLLCAEAFPGRPRIMYLKTDNKPHELHARFAGRYYIQESIYHIWGSTPDFAHRRS